MCHGESYHYKILSSIHEIIYYETCEYFEINIIYKRVIHTNIYYIHINICYNFFPLQKIIISL